MTQVRNEEGFTLVEFLVAIFVFSAISIAMYQVLFMTTRGSERAKDIVNTSEEARLGFNRLVRDTREGREVKSPSSQSFTVDIDFNGNGTIEPSPPDPLGSYESVRFDFNPVTGGFGTVTVTAAGSTETLMDGVDCIRKTDGTCNPAFTYRSSRLEYDANADGVTSSAELDAAPSIGNNNGVLDGNEIALVDVVAFALRVKVGGSIENFYAEAQLRNQR